MICIGTSGFSYSGWQEKFYPEDLEDKKQLEYFSKYFDTVELNNPFYHLPKKETFSSWKERTPDDFVFAVKVSRYITHRKYLKDCKEPWINFYNRAKALEEKLGAFLIHLPPRWTKNMERIENFVSMLKKISPDERYVFEFRNESWFDEELINFFEDQDNFTLCLTDSSEWFSNEEITGNFAYIRFHGPDKVYESKYNDELLKKWSDKIKNYLNNDLDVFCYFNNDFNAYAIEDAKKIKKMIKRQ